LFGIVLLIIAARMLLGAKARDLQVLATGLGGLVAAIAGLLTPFFWNSASAVQKASAEMTRLVTGFHGYMSRMRLLGLGFADLFSRQKADVQVLTSVANAAGDAMLDSAGVLADVAVWPSGKGTVKVPDVTGKTWAEAAQLAHERGLTITLKDLAYGDTAEGRVSGQSPTADSIVEVGTEIELTLSKGKKAEGEVMATVVPNVLGKTWSEADAMAKSAGLTTTYAGSRPDEATKDTVIAQEPSADVRVVSGTALKLTLSNGPTAVLLRKVPSLIGKSLADAKLALDAETLSLNIAGFVPHSTVEAGRVSGQDIPAGTQVAAKTAISVTISQGEP